MWIDTHCHLDAAEFDADRDAVVARARAAGVGCLVLPAVAAAGFDALRALAHAHGLPYALGIHPLYVDAADDGDLERLRDALQRHAGDPLLVAVGEIGLDHFVPGLDRERQARWYRAQLALARDAGLPVLLHVRRAVDAVLHGLRRCTVPGGIAHAFNGSAVQAAQAAAMGLKLGFGGAMTHPRALHLRTLARELPLDWLVMETDAPDIPPHWCVQPGDAAHGLPSVRLRNEPAELPRIAAEVAALRGVPVAELAAQTSASARAALPRLCALRPGQGVGAGTAAVVPPAFQAVGLQAVGLQAVGLQAVAPSGLVVPAHPAAPIPGWSAA